MMYFKAKFKTNTIGRATRYIYPEIWDKDKIDVLAYQEPERPGGEQEEYCVICVDDEYGSELKKHPNFTQISKEQAEKLAAEWRKPAPVTSPEIDNIVSRLDEKATKELLVKLSKKLNI